MKTFITTLSILFFFTACQAGSASNKPAEVVEPPVSQPADETCIQLALLLDTSNSMDGLIDQAKSRLWNIVNTLTTLKYQGKNPTIEIALYEYGNDWLSQKTGYIRQVAPFTTDLDLISEKLFSLRTNGGSEYCGAVIRDALQELKWKDGKVDMKLIYIAGNESFDQGNVSYKTSIRNALEKGVYVNTIYCGNHEMGIREFWKDGADRAQGKYFNIDSDAKVRYIATPYDDQIYRCNERLNKTYVSYGERGYEKQANQAVQDENAKSISKSNYTERVVSKSKAVYKNDSWDLVDKVKEDAGAVSKMDKKSLPKELQGKSDKEIEQYVQEKSKEREEVQKEISELAAKRQAYIDAELKKNPDQDDLGNAINTSILAFAKTKGYLTE